MLWVYDVYFSPYTTLRLKAIRGYVVGYLLWVEWSLQRDADGIAEVSNAEDYEGADLAPGEASDRYHGHTLLNLLPLHAAADVLCRGGTVSRRAAPTTAYL